MVAVKKMRQDMTFEEATQLPEVKALQRLNNHPNLVKIIELTKK